MRDRNDRKNGDKSKLSWREIDQMRDKSRRRDGDPMEKRSSPAAMVAQKSYRAALEKAFEAGTLGELAKTLSGTKDEPKAAPPAAAPATAAPATPTNGTSGTLPPAPPAAAAKDPERENRQKLLTRIKEAEGREPISRAIDAFLAKYPKLPDDYEVLTKALAHRDDDRVKTTIDQLTRLLDHGEKPRRGRTLVAQLRLLEDTHSDGEIRDLAARVRARL